MYTYAHDNNVHIIEFQGYCVVFQVVSLSIIMLVIYWAICAFKMHIFHHVIRR